MKLICVDLFCGAGGFSEGLVAAAEELGIEVELIAINHWPTAIATHSANHPNAKHICARIEQIRPRAIVPGGRVHLLLASPECTHFSIAAGSRPVDDQKRVPAFGIIHWLQELYVDNLIIENVPEFRSWAPLGANGKPLRSRRGETYQAFLQAIRACGFKRVIDKVVCCADYGDYTARKRLFIMGTRTGQPTWPDPSHCADAQPGLFTQKNQWRGVCEVLDWTLVGKSIFDRKKPLALKTRKRVAAGMRMFNGIEISSFLGLFEDDLKPTRPSKPRAQHEKLFSESGVEPFIVSIDHKGGNGHYAKTVNDPLTTVTTKARHALVNPYIIGAGGPERAGAPRSVNRPLNTVLSRNTMALIEPRIVDPLSQIVDPQVVDPQITEAEAFVVAAGGPEGKGRKPKSVSRPLDTILAENHSALVRPFIVTVNHGDNSTSKQKSARCHDVELPLPTITTSNSYGIVQAFLTKYYGTGTVQSLDEPLDTITTKERFALVEPRVVENPAGANSNSAQLIPLIPLGDGRFLDLRFRMLKTQEYAAATGFCRDYVFTGKQKDVMKQIGNAVPFHTATALCKERLKRYAQRRDPPAA